MHDDRMTLLLSVVVYICESFGGFDAVSYTDVIQGCIIIVALCIGPLYMSHHFGSLDGTVEFNCPGTWFEVVPDPDNDNATITKRRGCYAYKAPWNVLHPAVGYGYFFKPLWPTYGVDGSQWFNHLAILATNLFLYFPSYCCFPHVTCRLFASKSDFHCRKSIVGNNNLGLLAGLPGLILGFFYAIHVERMYPAGTVTFGGILDFMMRQGGAPEFFACMAACGGLAGIMSTIDSSALAITNIITKEIIVNGVFRVAPHLDTHRFMTIAERSSTGMVLIIALYFVIIFLAAKVESDPIEAKLMMNRIGFYQFGFVAQSLPATMCILHKRHIRPLALILGDVASLIILPALSVAFFEQKYYSTDVPEGQPPWLVLHPVLLSLLINAVITLLCNAVIPEAIADSFTIKADKEPLTFDQMESIMQGTVECMYNPVGKAMYVLWYALSIGGEKWFDESYNLCDFNTYKEYNEWIVDSSLPKPPDCVPEPTSPCGSFTRFGGTQLGMSICLFPTASILLLSWKPDPNSQEAEVAAK
jgi:Na+/proline symporter